MDTIKLGMLSCNVCSNQVEPIFEAKVLNSYNIVYYKCKNCGFIQTEKPYWLAQAYSNAITKLDIGLVQRNILFAETLQKLFAKHFFDPNGRFVDYGGGYGLFVRLMRDKGFDYYRQDIYCDNLFAEHFDADNLGGDTQFELLTAFEVFEHLENPVQELKKMSEYSTNILFSTELQPEGINFTSALDWWYFIPETGQHISLYTKKSLEILGKTQGFNFYSNGYSLHLYTKNKFKANPFDLIRTSLIDRVLNRIINRKKIKRQSLIPSDFAKIKSMLDKAQ